MRAPLAADAALPQHSVRDESLRPADSRYDWCRSQLSDSEVAARNERARLMRAVADFVALCRAEHVPPDAVVARFEAFLAAYSAGSVDQGHGEAAGSLSEVKDQT
jgi:hypothetical protein